MAFYRKKPVVIEAVQFRDNDTSIADIAKLAADATCTVAVDYGCDEVVMVIETLEGVMTAREDDYIVKGVFGELYPCKPDIFAETYERVLEVADGRIS